MQRTGCIRIIVAAQGDTIATQVLELIRTQSSSSKPRQFGSWTYDARGFRRAGGTVGEHAVTLLIVPALHNLKNIPTSREVEPQETLVVLSQEQVGEVARRFSPPRVNRFDMNAASFFHGEDQPLDGFPWIVFCKSAEGLGSAANQIAADYIWNAAARLKSGMAPWGQRKSAAQSPSRAGRHRKWNDRKRERTGMGI